MYDVAKKLDDSKLYKGMRYMAIRQTQAQLLSKLIVRRGCQH